MTVIFVQFATALNDSAWNLLELIIIITQNNIIVKLCDWLLIAITLVLKNIVVLIFVYFFFRNNSIQIKKITDKKLLIKNYCFLDKTAEGVLRPFLATLDVGGIFIPKQR